MKRIFLLSVLTLAMVGGVASADHRSHVHRSAATWSGGVRVTSPRVRVERRVVVKPRVVVHHHHHTVRRPIYVKAPVIRYHYYNYYQRPAVLVENYPPITGYYWVAGQWNWNGYEWIWTPGHYEPDPAYYTY